MIILWISCSQLSCSRSCSRTKDHFQIHINLVIKLNKFEFKKILVLIYFVIKNLLTFGYVMFRLKKIEIPIAKFLQQKFLQICCLNILWNIVGLYGIMRIIKISLGKKIKKKWLALAQLKIFGGMRCYICLLLILLV